jgi:hypothetical protein
LSFSLWLHCNILYTHAKKVTFYILGLWNDKDLRLWTVLLFIYITISL